jgi:translocation and assembly module TamB
VGKVPLARTVLSLPVVEYVTGDIKVDVAISGQYDDPELKGGINLEGGGISIPVGNTVLGASDVSTKVLFSGTTISIPTLTAKVGGGVLVGSALLRNSFDDLERSFEVNMNLDRITLEPIDNFSSRISGEARIRAEALGVPEVWARLRVLDAIYEDEVDLTQILRTMTKRILGREDARATGATGGSRDSGKSGQIIALDLEVKAEDGLIIETNIAEVELGASLAVLGTTKNPKVDGRVYTIDGVFGFEGTRFDIIKGDLQFSGTAERPDPRVNIVGETSVSTLEYGEQKVQIIIEGSLTEPEVTFTSDAGLSREEILRIISSGAGVRGLELFGGKTKEYTFKELVSLRSDVGLLDRLRGLTGVTTVEITTGLSSSTGEFVPTVVAKRPFTDKLALQIESELAGEKTSKLSVEYPLTPFLSLVGGWTDNPPTADGSESSGSFSVGFNYRRAFPPMLSPFRTLIKKRED